MYVSIFLFTYLKEQLVVKLHDPIYIFEIFIFDIVIYYMFLGSQYFMKNKSYLN